MSTLENSETTVSDIFFHQMVAFSSHWKVFDLRAVAQIQRFQQWICL